MAAVKRKKSQQMRADISGDNVMGLQMSGEYLPAAGFPKQDLKSEVTIVRGSRPETGMILQLRSTPINKLLSIDK